MKGKHRIKLAIDIAMTVILPVVMAQLITGTEFHEWLGTAMMAVFILHHVVNRKWFPYLFKGKYNAVRVWGTVINILMLLDMILLAVSGISQSSYVFKALPRFMAKTSAGRLHIWAGWWGFILMSLHLGIHIRLMTAYILKGEKKNDSSKSPKVMKMFRIVLRLLTVGMGTAVFIRLQVMEYLFMNVPFAYYTDAERPILYFAEIIILMAAFTTVGSVINEILIIISSKRRMQ